MAPLRLNKKDLFLLGLTLAVVVGGVYAVWSANVVVRVFLVNGLDVATQIAVDGNTRGVPPGGRVEITLHRGVHQVRVTGVKGELLEEGPIEVPSTDGAVAVNLLGAAPLYTETITYGGGAGRGGSPALVLHGAKRLVVSQADFVFIPAPATISVDKSSSGSHTRSHFDLAAGGWQTTTRWLRERGDAASALRVSLAVARAEPTVDDAIQAVARGLSELRGPRIALAYVRKALESQPDAYDLHRLHQHLMRRAGQGVEARAFYRSYREQHEKSALAAVLLARVEEPERAEELFQEALALDPQSLPARRGLAQLLFDRGRFSESARLFDEVARGNDPDYKYYVDDHVRALIRQGEPAKAAEVASAAVKKAPTEWTLAVLYAELARTEGVPTTILAPTYVDALAQKSRDPEYGVWMRSLAGVPVEPKALQTVQLQGGPMAHAAALQIAAQKDPAQAWMLMAKAGPEVLDRLASPVALLLAAEFFRAGDTKTADRLFASRTDLGLPPDALKAYLTTGAEHPDFWRLPTDVRAVLDFVRARKLAGDGTPDPGLYAAATRREAYLGLVGRTLKSWPPPERAHSSSLVLHRRPGP